MILANDGQFAFKDVLFYLHFWVKTGHTWGKNGTCTIFTLSSRITKWAKNETLQSFQYHYLMLLYATFA